MNLYLTVLLYFAGAFISMWNILIMKEGIKYE